MYIRTTNINFTAGKVHIYSDFDGTYFPAKQGDVRKSESNTDLKKYFEKTDKFFKSTQDGIHLHITTGRTFGEYKTVCDLLNKKNISFTIPKTVITKNGSDEYIRSGDGHFPFSYQNTNKLKEEDIKKQTNWDGIKIKEFLKNLAAKYNKRFVEADSNGSVKDHGEASLYANGKLTPNDPHVVGYRREGNLKLNFNMAEDKAFANEVENFLKSNNIKYCFSQKPMKNTFYTSYSFCPKLSDGPLTKLYDTKEALKKAILNNDIIIVAGNERNDFEMLNPLEYLDEEFLRECESKSQNKTFYRDKNVMLKELKSLSTEMKKELETNGFLKRLEELPIYGIVINEKDAALKPLSDVFSASGKIITAEPGELEEGIRKAIKHHADKNKKFRSGMPANLRKEIFKTGKKITKAGYAAASAGILAIIYTIHKFSSKSPNKDSA